MVFGGGVERGAADQKSGRASFAFFRRQYGVGIAAFGGLDLVVGGRPGGGPAGRCEVGVPVVAAAGAGRCCGGDACGCSGRAATTDGARDASGMRVLEMTRCSGSAGALAAAGSAAAGAGASTGAGAGGTAAAGATTGAE